MAVVIDEFEIVTEPPPTPTVSRAEAEMSAPSAEDALTAQDIELIAERQMERCARVRAH